MPTHFLENKTSACIVVTWEGKTPQPQMPLLPLPSPTFLWMNTALYGMVSCPGGTHPAYSLVGQNRKKQTNEKTNQNTFMLCKHYSARAKKSVFHQYCITHKSRTKHHTDCYKENQLHLSQTQYIVTNNFESIRAFKCTKYIWNFTVILYF